jgi:26S proteasome regulatory subunit N7
MSDDQNIPKIPNMEISKARFLLANGPKELNQQAKDLIMKHVKEDEMAPFYELICKEFNFPIDNNLLNQLKKTNEEKLKQIEEKLEDAQQNLGETEISDALISKAEYLAKIGYKEKALSAYRVAYEKTGPLGQRIDMLFLQIRMGFFWNDNELTNKNIEKAKALIEEGGDWDRRNRLKVYQGINFLINRDFKSATPLLLDTLATFSSSELMEYKEFVKYAVLSSMITLKRPDLNAKVINAPEILEVVNDIPYLEQYMNSLYNCEYANFFKALANIEQQLKLDPVLFTHYKYYVREMRIISYAQLLESYRSVTIESMASSFGVSEKFIDDDLSRFIGAGRLNCVIDKVDGIVQTNRPDSKNAQYQLAIKQGDILLNRVQKLSRVINS